MQLLFNTMILMFVSALFLSTPARAQEESPDSGKELEQLIAPENQSSKDDETPEKPQAPLEKIDPKELSDLGRLAPFSDIAVIQKRFLPKTGRLEFFPSVGTILNDVFFMEPILAGRLGYYFTEQYGVEASFISLSKSDREVVRDLQKRGVVTESVAVPQSYYGLDLKWTPVYGKMGFMSKSVIPFDLYFLGGAGVTNTDQKTSPTTVHLGTGQIFALSKWMAFRWDLGFYWYSTKSTVGPNSGVENSYMNMHLTIGASFFFPEAKYR